MRYLLSLFLIVVMSNASAIETVPDLSLEKYMGKWYQLAAIPQSFAKNCVANTTAEYELMDDNKVKVINSCNEADGALSQVEGRVRINPKFSQNSKLQVTFVNLLWSWVWAFGGDYWVIDLDDNYRWAVVGHPKLSGLYILSRTPSLPQSKLKGIRNYVESVGYDSCDVFMSPITAGVYQSTDRLCDIN